MNRLLEVTAESRRMHEKLFCAFLTLGYPSVKDTEKLIYAFDQAGVDILELGFPFSDPLADGPTIQFSSEVAIKNGVTVKDAFDLVKRVRENGCGMPILFFSYFNPILNYGPEKFLKEAYAAGFDGLIIPDLPPDEELDFHVEASRRKLSEVFLITPTTNPSRCRMIAEQSEGFIYYVSLRGVTGARASLPSDVNRHLAQIKKYTDTPILVGFGVSTPEQARRLSRAGDGVIVGSAIIEKIRQSKGRLEPVVRFVKSMIRAIQD